MDTQPPALWTVHDVADWLGQPANKVTRMARNKQIPAVMLPSGDFVFDRGELARWLAGLRSAEVQPCS